MPVLIIKISCGHRLTICFRFHHQAAELSIGLEGVRGNADSVRGSFTLRQVFHASILFIGSSWVLILVRHNGVQKSRRDQQGQGQGCIYIAAKPTPVHALRVQLYTAFIGDRGNVHAGPDELLLQYRHRRTPYLTNDATASPEVYVLRTQTMVPWMTCMRPCRCTSMRALRACQTGTSFIGKIAEI